MPQSQCAVDPDRGGRGGVSLKRKADGTCLSLQNLRVIAAAYNARVSPTGGKRIDNAEGMPKAALLAALRRVLSPLCADERCWLQLWFLSDANAESRKELQAAFAPVQPHEWRQDPNKWLSNIDIEKAVEAHCSRARAFRFLGVQSMDFMSRLRNGECVSNLCGLNMQDMHERNVHRCALVVNTDYHTEKGSHWVAFFVQLAGRFRGMYYFDSTGRPPTREMDTFRDRLADQISAMRTQDASLRQLQELYAFNDIQQQRGGTECGMFCIYFILQMLRLKGDFKKVCTQMGDDITMMRLRSVLFDATEPKAAQQTKRPTKQTKRPTKKPVAIKAHR